MLLGRDECRRQEKRVGLVGDVGQWSFTCISVGQPPPRPAIKPIVNHHVWTNPSLKGAFRVTRHLGRSVTQYVFG
jgi:hypothetical protein